MTDHSYTTEEVAKLLKVSKLTIYDLIKKGLLPSYRVGKQMRIDAADLESYKRSSMTAAGSSSEQAASVDLPHTGSPAASGSGSLVITGQEISLDLLARYLERENPAYRPLRSYAGSIAGLISLIQGQSDIASTHLLDAESGEYNLPYISKLLTGYDYMVINLLKRKAGLYVQAGNPKSLLSWRDLEKPGLVLANREKGSGARVLLDEQLRIHHIDRHSLQGYEREETSHMGVASRISSGTADVGVGTEKTARLAGEVDFIPLIEERYDLVVLKTPQSTKWIPSLLGVIRSDAFQSELAALQGYDLTLSGQVLYET
ncbi:hypothetical protein DCC85_06810 [Paenibacillus sp. CAA11]|uniref:helix-turn-helix transcriptional regulator n=1 Tax=Paenibacillus sp. CAA11 TaxID=1532905 RepID=UPI000D36EDD5|nr:helix-turn-helix transcriptional regulator [Paenibacillus sp. CAA11]AWB43960.1 hypothetical protein DCC85_06810 [Paenibacillus sp. CAA11]